MPDNFDQLFQDRRRRGCPPCPPCPCGRNRREDRRDDRRDDRRGRNDNWPWR